MFDHWALALYPGALAQSYRVVVCTEDKQSFDRDRRFERECRQLTCITFRLQKGKLDPASPETYSVSMI